MDIDFLNAPDDFTPSSDMRAWVRAAEPCDVSALMYQHGDFPFPAAGVVPPEYMMVMAPGLVRTVSFSSIMVLSIEFDKAGRWVAANMRNNMNSWLTLPSFNDGYTVEEGAEFALLQMEQNDTSKGWSEQRRLAGKWTSAQGRADSNVRIAVLARNRIARQVRVEALEMIAKEHEEEFEAAWEAAQVARALKSDWFPSSR